MTIPPRPFSPAAAEQICRVLGEAVTGSEIPNLIAPLKASEAPGEEMNTKWKRLFNAVATAQNRQQDGRPLVRLILAVMNPVRFSSQARYDECRAQVNEKLLFSGLRVREDGKVVRETRSATTVAEAKQRADDLRAELQRRDVHADVLHFCRAELLQQHVGHQVKLFKTVTPVYGPPKGGKPRDVPLPHQAAEALAEHLERFPAAEITLPWQSPDGRPRTFALVFTGDKGGPCNRAAFNSKIWVPARRRAGIPDRAEDEGGAGMHQLRHHFASLLLRGGVDIKRVQEWLGHHGAAFTLDIYGHLMPDDHEASLRQVEAIFAAALRSAPDGPETAQPGREGH